MVAGFGVAPMQVALPLFTSMSVFTASDVDQVPIGITAAIAQPLETFLIGMNCTTLPGEGDVWSAVALAGLTRFVTVQSRSLPPHPIHSRDDVANSIAITAGVALLLIESSISAKFSTVLIESPSESHARKPPFPNQDIAAK
jgi:hypothetical protein